ncbi:armadillo-type protein [Podospora conica]|nr:armadillo-type protein [Schizothecium conicum]
MSVPRARLLDLMKVQCQIFQTTFNPEGIRTGNKILRQRLRGPALLSYYPQKLVTFKHLQKKFEKYDLITYEEEEEDRQEHIAALKARGKGAPKKKKEAPPANRMSTAACLAHGWMLTLSSEKEEVVGGMRSLPDKTLFPTLDRSISALSTSRLANQGAYKSQSHEAANESDPMDQLLAQLSEQQKRSFQQGTASTCDLDLTSQMSHLTLESHENINPQSLPTPTEDDSSAELAANLDTTNVPDHIPTPAEVIALKIELVRARNQITRMGQELALQFPPKPDMEATDHQASSSMASRVPPPTYNPHGISPQPRAHGHSPWGPPVAEEMPTETSAEHMSTSAFARARGIWNNAPRNTFGTQYTQVSLPTADDMNSPPWGNNNRTAMQPAATYDAPGSYGAPAPGYFSRPDRSGAKNNIARPRHGRSSRFDNPSRHGNSTFTNSFNGFDMNTAYQHSRYDAVPTNASPGLLVTGYQRSTGYGGTLSPHAAEFTSSSSGLAPWKNDASSISDGPTYLSATEPLNYRRLLDRNVTCDWKYIVDKIVCNNDQQASIFLQQKLKVGTPEQKYAIVEAIVSQAYPLMVNRFGNFLVQRCFEHGTPEQVVKIAESIRGNTLNLSMDAFGCHVIQKAFDSVPEDYKAIMVHELLRRIPETVVHRYACHVWQKLFELRWTETPPQIMVHVNEALDGMWHEVALGETGSLVVQNIFENCLEEDKRPCIEEVLANIDIVAHGQFGNWCIQHICEHGAPADRSRAIDHVIRFAAEYSMDQFASKVVEKCLKIRGPEFLGRYLDRVCEGRVDRPRIPLIDIASDQYGNYLIQYILTNSNQIHREMVAAHIRKHMVSLRGSKFGSRVGMLCTNHASATRPGPPMGPGMARGGMGGRFGNPAFNR